MGRWQAEMDQKRLGVVEAEDEDEVVDTAARISLVRKFRD
jgi:hypothetical protein